MRRDRDALLRAFLRSRGFLFGVIGVGLMACATPTKRYSGDEEAQKLFSQVCGGRNRLAEPATGSLKMSIKSKEVSGQFSGELDWNSASDLRIEITNPFGGTEARLHMKPTLTLEIPKESRVEAFPGKIWGGIPLEWAGQLFGGLIPCPNAQMKTLTRVKDELIFSTEEGAQYRYRFRDFHGKPWVDYFQAGEVEVVLDRPDEESGFPMSFLAKSSQGEIKVKWSERKAKKK